MTVAACLKWVDLRPEVDPLTGAVRHDVRSSGASEADLAALEWALRAGEAWAEPVLAVTAGPPAADAVLRDALAAGAHTAVRVDLVADAPSSAVASALAGPLGGCRLVFCGDLSADRGTGAVPAHLAGRLGASQALGLVEVMLGSPGALTGLRRLDGGRRERLGILGPAVCSVEGATARVRRAPLAAVLAARDAPITVIPGPAVGPDHHGPTRPFRPRPRVLAAPRGADALERVRALTAATVVTAHGPPEVLAPDAAADRLLAALVAWGYGPPGEAGR